MDPRAFRRVKGGDDMFLGLDPLYWMMLAPALLLSLLAQGLIRAAYAKAQRVPVRSGVTGAQAAAAILRAHGMEGVSIEMSRGMLSDHYDPRHRVLRLSPDVYAGRSLASVGIAAHEVGHALQHAHGYAPLKLRNGIVPLAAIGGDVSMLLLFLGVIMGMTGLVLAAIVLYSAVVLFQIVNLPVEFNASSRARRELVRIGLVDPDEDRPVGKVLNAAALTYVAATLTAILTLIYFLIRAGILGGGRDE